MSYTHRNTVSLYGLCHKRQDTILLAVTSTTITEPKVHVAGIIFHICALKAVTNPHQNCLALIMRGHNVCFHQQLKIIITVNF